MKLSRHALATAAGSLAAALLVPAFASCADSGSNSEPPRDDAGPDTRLVELDAAADGDVDASGPLGCDEADWCPVVSTGIDTRNALTAIWGSGKNDVWAVGSSGAVVHFDGSSWKPIPSGTNQTLRGVWGSGPNDVWIVSTPTLVLHGSGFSAGAATFELAPEIPQVVTHRSTLTHAVWGTSATDVWIGGEAIPIDWDIYEHAHGWRSGTPDGGAPWENMFIGKRSDRVTIRSLWGSGPDDVWAVGGDDEVIMNDDGSQSFVSRGRAFHTTGDDPGTAPSWTEYDTQSNAVLNAVWGTKGGDVWAVGRKGTIRRLRSDAVRWEAVASPTTENLRGLWGAAANDIWAVGDEGTLIHFDGTRWATSSAAFAPGPRPELHAVWGSGPNDVWAVGDQGVLHFSGKKSGGGQ